MSSQDQTKQAARTAIRKIAKTYNKDFVDIFFATVNKVDKAARTCDVTPITGANATPITDVDLMPDANDGDLKIPKVNSTVAVAINNQLTPFVVAWSDLEEIILKGGLFGGLLKHAETKAALDGLQQQINTVKQATLTAITVYSAVIDAGASAAAFGTTVNAIVPILTNNLQNTKITHGDK